VAQAQQMTQLRVAYIPVITWLPALVAKEEGIFEKNGLDVTFTKFPNLINLPGTLGKSSISRRRRRRICSTRWRAA